MTTHERFDERYDGETRNHAMNVPRRVRYPRAEAGPLLNQVFCFIVILGAVLEWI